jgi:Cu2+-containing amine oxidase
MNVFVQELARQSISAKPDESPKKLVVEDNIGEGVHIHHRNVRLEMSIDDFQQLAKTMEIAAEKVKNGDC